MAYDLYPGFTDVPPETWDGVDVEQAVDYMIERTGIPEEDLPADLGLLGLARLMKPPILSDAERERLSRVSPDLLARLERSIAQQWREYDLRNS